MPNFGRTSQKRLDTCHEDLQLILREAILYVDFSVVQGHRPVETQFEYYTRGRTQNSKGIWYVSDQSKVITNIDGYKKKGKHNYDPSMAVDILPYYNGKVDWNDRERFRNIVYFIKGLAYAMGYELRIGADWNGNFTASDQSFMDVPHMELYKRINPHTGLWVKYV
jgi:peptidoglycan LD-endopeptidase CwlK